MNSIYCNLDNFVEISLYEEEGKEFREIIERTLNDEFSFPQKRFSIEEKIGRDYKNKKCRLVLYKEFGEDINYEDFERIEFGYRFLNGIKEYRIRLIKNGGKEKKYIKISNLPDIKFKIEI